MLSRHKTVWTLVVALAALTMVQESPAQTAEPSGQLDRKNCVTVFGAVRNPARFELAEPKRLSEVIALAGGLTTLAGRRLQVVHTGLNCSSIDQLPNASVTTEWYDRDDLARENDPQLAPGDFVVVPEGSLIYVVGCVVAPQAMNLDADLKLSQALAKAGALPATLAGKSSGSSEMWHDQRISVRRLPLT